ncbi:RNA polymerase sigma factor [Sphingorhabdus soli]|uniref:RNA polymerase sigma factor n=1 Tax=Flavisphingopyxis soli TaxID=2601267 RepID=A0A5C6UAX5_9SPHN|nr:RNA polymerase sigma factor [Sphingorhabdus soli]TXC69156.1 RNA polymerase sigma factor [Sphingorhabdus soli]
MDQPDHKSGLEVVFLENRTRIIRFLRARGADDPEDLVQEIWVRVKEASIGPVGAPIAYLYRIANRLMIDRYRADQTAKKRDTDWHSTTILETMPSEESKLQWRDEATRILAVLDRLGPRASTVFRLHRIDGLSQKSVAIQLGVSVSTVESDLRSAYRAVHEWRVRRDKA